MLPLARALLIVVLWPLPAVAAGVPEPTRCTVPPLIRLVAPRASGWEAAAEYSVIVRDLAASPLPGQPVMLDFGFCTDVQFGREQPYPSDVVVSCPPGPPTLTATTDASGTARFVVAGFVVARTAGSADLACVRVFAGTPPVLIGLASAPALDQDQGDGLTANDMSLWLGDYMSATLFGTYAARSDYDGSVSIALPDLSIWCGEFFNSRGGSHTAATCGPQGPQLVSDAGPANSLRLRWDQCAGDGGSQLHTFACNSNAGYEYLVASFIAPPCVEALTGFEAQVWVVPPQGVPLPDWWRYEPGGCRAASLGMSVGVGTEGELCEALPEVDRRAMAAAELMGALYWRLLGTITARRFDVFAPTRVRLSKPLKLFLIARTGLRLATGRTLPNYGF